MQDAFDQLTAATSTQEIADALVCAGAAFDVAYASHRVIHAGGIVQGVTTMPEAWITHYRASGYDRFDPGAQRAQTFIGAGGDSFEAPPPGEVWSPEVIQMNREIRELHAAGSFFVAHSTPQPGLTSMVNFITDASGPRYRRWVEACGPKLRLVAAAAHARAAELTGAAEEGVALTTRERDALRWLAEGHRVDRIAERMGVSNRTVEVHLASARHRLGAKTREQALAIALSSGLFRTH
ncbi:MAG: LuxR C-terminal-related transcriptional regulator [Pseudomonadota bacterium]